MRRPPAKWPDATTKTVVTYAYNGAGRVAKVQYGDAGLRLNYWGSSETDDNYQHYDRFGRIGTQKWEDYTPTVTVVDQFDYTHDYAGNRLTRDIPASLYATNDKDQVYTYDLLHRLKTFDEGTLVGTSISGTPKKEEDWTLDALGNWTGLIKKTNGTTDLNQTRAHNDANEVGTISATVGTDWADPTHDNAGNTTRIPQPTSLAKAYDLTYDAWNRLVKVVDNDTALTVATFEYDGRNYRIIKVDVAADPDKTYHYYYNESWQCLEMRLDASTSPKEQYFWGTHYIDALAVRYWDSNGDTDFLDTDEVQYYSHDANFNVTGVYTTAGVAAERYRYTPYGDLLVLDANFANDADGLSDFANATTFTGRLLDTEYGQYYFRNRNYGSGLGRFGARDPIAYESLDLNLYSYGGGNPESGSDPFGLRWWYVPTFFDFPVGSRQPTPGVCGQATWQIRWNIPSKARSKRPFGWIVQEMEVDFEILDCNGCPAYPHPDDQHYVEAWFYSCPKTGGCQYFRGRPGVHGDARILEISSDRHHDSWDTPSFRERKGKITIRGKAQYSNIATAPESWQPGNAGGVDWAGTLPSINWRQADLPQWDENNGRVRTMVVEFDCCPGSPDHTSTVTVQHGLGK